MMRLMPMQKLGIYEDFNITNPQDNIYKYRKSKFLVPGVTESFFERLYGDWKTPRESHVHLFDYSLTKKSYNLEQIFLSIFIYNIIMFENYEIETSYGKRDMLKFTPQNNNNKSSDYLIFVNG